MDMTTVVGFHMLFSKVFGIRYPSQFLHLYPDLPFFISFKLSAPLFSFPLHNTCSWILLPHSLHSPLPVSWLTWILWFKYTYQKNRMYYLQIEKQKMWHLTVCVGVISFRKIASNSIHLPEFFMFHHRWVIARRYMNIFVIDSSAGWYLGFFYFLAIVKRPPIDINELRSLK